MIRLHDLSKGFWYQGEYRTVFDGLDITLPSGQSLHCWAAMVQANRP